ncbi:MAG: hypothetical protein AAF447_26320 [Myxococcota bacterium]
MASVGCDTLLHEASQHRLRDIDRLATGARQSAARAKKDTVDGHLVEASLDDADFD